MLIAQENSNDTGQMSPMQATSEPLEPDLRSNSLSRKEQGSPNIKVEAQDDGPNKVVREQLVYAEMLETREKLIKEIQT